MSASRTATRQPWRRSFNGWRGSRGATGTAGAWLLAAFVAALLLAVSAALAVYF